MNNEGRPAKNGRRRHITSAQPSTEADASHETEQLGRPRLIFEIAIEEPLAIRSPDVVTDVDRNRLAFWIMSQPRLHELVRGLLLLEACAAVIPSGPATGLRLGELVERTGAEEWIESALSQPHPPAFENALAIVARERFPNAWARSRKVDG